MRSRCTYDSCNSRLTEAWSLLWQRIPCLTSLLLLYPEVTGKDEAENHHLHGGSLRLSSKLHADLSQCQSWSAAARLNAWPSTPVWLVKLVVSRSTRACLVMLAMPPRYNNLSATTIERCFPDEAVLLSETLSSCTSMLLLVWNKTVSDVKLYTTQKTIQKVKGLPRLIKF